MSEVEPAIATIPNIQLAIICETSGRSFRYATNAIPNPPAENMIRSIRLSITFWLADKWKLRFTSCVN